MAEKTRYRRDGGTRLDGQRRGGVTKIVRSDVRAQSFNGGIEGAIAFRYGRTVSKTDAGPEAMIDACPRRPRSHCH
jgi:hypothetical protein